MSGPDNVFEIVIAGPVAPDFLVTIGGRQYVLSSNGRAYPVQELARIAPLFMARRVFRSHISDDGPTRTRVLQGSKGEVGRLVSVWWNPMQREMRGMLEVTAWKWQREFYDRDRRGAWGFSVDVEVSYVVKAGLEIVDEITRIHSVDLVEYAALGGRFVDAPALDKRRLEEERANLEYARELRLQGKTI